MQIDENTNADLIEPEIVTSPLLKRRRFEGEETQIEKYVGRQKLKAHLLPVDDTVRKIDDTSFKFA